MDDTYDQRRQGGPMTNEELKAIERRGRDPLNFYEDARDGLEQLGADVVALVAVVRESRATEQNLRDAMYRGHAGLSCKQIAEMADQNIEWCRQAQEQRDVANKTGERWRKECDRALNVGQLWKALAQARARHANALRRSQREAISAFADVEEAFHSLSQAGIDPDAP